MNKKEFIKVYRLVKGEKNYFYNGTERIERIMYKDPYGNTFIFLNNDLYTVKPESHSILAGHSWYK